jgi:hypothetical protein
MPEPLEHGSDLPESLGAAERLLRRFTPANPSIDRDRLMFLAGQRSISSRGLGSYLWPASTAVLAATSLTLACFLLRQPGDERQAIVRSPLPPPAHQASEQPRAVASPAEVPVKEASRATSTSLVSENYVRTREVALRLGLDALGSTDTFGLSRESTKSYGQVLFDLGHDRNGASEPNARRSSDLSM